MLARPAPVHIEGLAVENRGVGLRFVSICVTERGPFLFACDELRRLIRSRDPVDCCWFVKMKVGWMGRVIAKKGRTVFGSKKEDPFQGLAINCCLAARKSLIPIKYRNCNFFSVS